VIEDFTSSLNQQSADGPQFSSTTARSPFRDPRV
jgi:hypothetical protein